MGCLELVILVAVGITLIGLFIFAVKAAFLAILGGLLLGGIGYFFFGAAGLKIGSILGVLLGLGSAFSG